jgi:chromosomal replication initiation ATPase DnaA
MAEQLTFALPHKQALGREYFFVSPANQLAVALLENWGDWPQAKMVLTGPARSGKTHLAHVWASETGAQVTSADALNTLDLAEAAQGPWVVEDIDQITCDRDAETQMFHFHNLMQAGGHALLITSQSPPTALEFAIADLASRMQATAIAKIESPDDMLLTAVLMKQFSERQINIPAKLLDYIIPRLPGSFAAAHMLVEQMDSRAMAEKRPIGQSLARDVLEGLLDKNTSDPA